VETLKDGANDEEGDSGNGEREVDNFGTLAELLIVDSGSDASEEVIADDQIGGTGLIATVVVEIDACVADAAEESGEVAQVAGRGALGADGAIGDHIPRTGAHAVAQIHVVVGRTGLA